MNHSNALQPRILSFFNYARCFTEKPGNESMARWARLNVGLTPTGIQVWCVRHRMEVVSLTAASLAEMLETPLQCVCCLNGTHIVMPSRAEEPS